MLTTTSKMVFLVALLLVDSSFSGVRGDSAAGQPNGSGERLGRDSAVSVRSVVQTERESAARPGDVVRAAGGPSYFKMIPVLPQGLAADPYPPGTVINGNTITFIQVPARVWLEVRYGGWGTVNGGLGCPAATLDLVSFASGDGGALVPANVVCNGSNQICEDEIGVGAGSGCLNQSSTRCGRSFTDLTRPDLLHFQAIGCQSEANMTCFAFQIIDAPFPDDNLEHYHSTHVLDIPSNAEGSYTIGFLNNGVDTFFLLNNGMAGLEQLLPAVVNVVGGCCMPNGSCTAISPTCSMMGGTLVQTCRGDCNNNGRDDACEGYVDCNGNDQFDTCDVTEGISEDCNRNFKPDECESQTDCDGNSVQDVCDIVDHSANDCNWNNIPDSCDIDNGLLVDENLDDVPDVCQNKSRFISFPPPPAGTDYAIRLKLVNLDRFPSMNGQIRWLDAAAEFINGQISAGTFWASTVVCDPALHQWPAVAELSAYGPAIVPNSEYEVRFADAACLALGEESCMTPPIVLKTTKWGDVSDPFQGFGSTSQPSARDFVSIVDKFRDLSTAIHYTKARLAGNEIDPTIHVNFTDISACIESYRNLPYPHMGPSGCP